MKLSLSTNWCSRRTPDGEEIAEKAAGLGFEELELGYAATEAQAEGIRRRLDLIPVGSVHAFCPAPISAPHAHPELYSLTDSDAEGAELARFHVARCIEFASGLGAETVVLHAGRTPLCGIFDRLDSRRLDEVLGKCGNDVLSRIYMKALSLATERRLKRGRGTLERFRRSLEALIPVLEKNSVVLALENMPYLEGFPCESEMNALLAEFAGAPLKAWFDTGHHLVRVNHGWTRGVCPFRNDAVAGLHLNDVENLSDDHLAPGEGNVDFAALRPLAQSVRHVVFEPSPTVSEESLERAIAFIRDCWRLPPCR